MDKRQDNMTSKYIPNRIQFNIFEALNYCSMLTVS